MRVAKKDIDAGSAGGIGLGIDIDFEPQKGRPDGRLPIGDSGFYRTPDVISPYDKVNYPDSPFNGGNPISRDIIGADVDVKIHPCGFDIDAQGTLGFTKLPIHGVSWRAEGECRNEPPPPPPPDTSNIPERSDTSSSSGFNDNKRGISDSANVYALIGITAFGWDYLSDGCAADNDPLALIPDGGTAYGGIMRCPYPGETHKDFSGFVRDTEIVIKYTLANIYTKYIEVECPTPFNPEGKANKFSGVGTDISDIEEKWNRLDAAGSYVDVSLVTFKVWRTRYVSNGAVKRVVNSQTDAPPPYETYTEAWFPASKIHLVFGRYGLIKSAFTQQIALEPEDIEYPGAGSYLHKELMDVIDPNNCPDFNPYRKNNPPRDTEEEKDCCMSCCSKSGREENEESELLKKIYKECKKMNKALGSDEFPAPFPASFITDTDDWLTELLPKPEVSIANMALLQKYALERFDEIMGQWVIPIEIKDSDPTKPGDQPSGVKFYNLAEALAEIGAITINTSINSEVLKNMSSRILYETGTTRKMVYTNHSRLQALIDFFGFKVKEVVEKVACSFTAGKDKLDEFLKESEIEVATVKFDDKKKSYKDDMAKLLHSAAIVSTQNFRKIKAKDAIGAAAELAKHIKDLKGNKEKLDATTDKNADEDFEAFCEDFEKGFTDIPNIDNPSQPFGEAYDQRPKVIRLRKPDEV